MSTHNERGAINILLVPLILAVVFFLASISFAIWAYQSRQDYKNNSDQKVATAVTAAKQEESIAKDKQFAEAEKNPLKTYTSPSAYGSVSVQYPKTWSAYVSDDGNSQPYVEGYFHPSVVPNVTLDSRAFALRVQVIGQSYSDSLRNYQSQIKSGTIKAAAYAFPKVQSVIGTRLTGQLTSQKTGDMVLVPLRDKTLKVWTDGSQFENDFNNIILPNLTFSP